MGRRRQLLARTTVLAAAAVSSLAYAQEIQPSQAAADEPPIARDGPGQATPGGEAANLFGRDRNVSVSQRPRTGYEAKGIRLGAFTAWPKITLAAEYTDNVFATENNQVDDVIYRISPEISIASDWSRHALNAYARMRLNRFVDNDSEDSDDYSVGLGGSLDVLRDTVVDADVAWSRFAEARTSRDSPDLAAEPVTYDTASLRLAARHDFSRIRISGGVNVQKFDYENVPRVIGGVVDQDFRDRTITLISARADYAISPATAVFVEIGGNQRDYDQPGRLGEVSRDSDGFALLGGLNFELGALFRGDIGFGYVQQEYEDPRLEAVDGFGARAELEWFPTQLTTLTFSASRSIDDSGLPGPSVLLSTDLSARVDHELLRNVILTLQISDGRDDYDFLDRTDHRNSVRFSGSYLMNRALGVTAGYAYDRLDAERGLRRSFEAHSFMLSLTAQI